MSKTLTKIQDNIKEQMRLFFKKNQVIELRALNPRTGYNRIISGYFDNVDDFAKEAAKLNGNWGGVYFTPNPVNPALIARSKNKAKVSKITTQDGDVESRQWLLIDIDPERPVGISSTDEQHKISIEMAYAIIGFILESIGRDNIGYFIASSGNGAHLCIKINLPNDDETAQMICGFLNFLHLKFSTDTHSIDTKVFNASRIWKVYGTTAMKGDNTEERPHRESKILEIHPGKNLKPEEIAEFVKRLPKPEETISLTDSEFRLDEFIKKHGIKIYDTKDWNGGKVYTIDCPWNSSHTRDAFVGHKADGTVFAGCFHAHCAGKQWHDFRLFYDPAAYDRTGTSGSNGNGKNGKIKKKLVKIAKMLCDKYHPFTMNDFLYIYQDGRFTKHSEFVQTEIQTILDEHTTNTNVNEIIGYMRRYRFLTPDQVNPYGKTHINLMNGMLNWRTDKLEPHDPKFLSTIRIPIKYNPEATCPTIEAFLQKLLPKYINVETGELPLIYEIFGSTLTSCTDVKQRALMCYGRAGTGKTQLITLLQMAVGKENCCNVTLKQMSEDRFMVAELYQKLLNAADDIDNKTILNSDDIKKVIKPTQLSGQHKFHDPFFFTPFATHVFSCNELPGTSDKTEGFWDRWIVLRFENRIRGTGQQVENYAEKIATPEELSGMLNKGLAGLKRILEHGLSITDEIKEELEAFREKADPVLSFINECCRLDDKAHCHAPGLYIKYQSWCNDSHLKGYGRNNFYSHICDCYNIRKYKNEFYGIGIIDETYDNKIEYDDDDQPSWKMPF